MNLMFIPFLFFEFGVMAPQAAHSDISGYISFDAKIPLAHVDTRYLPVLIGGYSRLFETGHAVDYGIALAVPRKSDGEPRSYQFEFRDYWTFADPHQHNIMLRIGWLVGASD